jgi:ribosomal protein S18 acetylase RimI-like enzyme
MNPKRGPWRVAPMMATDYDEAVALWRISPGVGLNESDERAPLTAYLARNPGLSQVARLGGAELVGAVLCGHDGRRGYLHHLAVAEAYRRRGLGRELVERALEALKAAGIGKCNIFVFDDNAAARDFWTKLEFRRPAWSVMQCVIAAPA